MRTDDVLNLHAYLLSIGIYAPTKSRKIFRKLVCVELILNLDDMDLVTFCNYLFDIHQLN